MHKHTRATPANIPRSRGRFTRRARKGERRRFLNNVFWTCIAHRGPCGLSQDTEGRWRPVTYEDYLALHRKVFNGPVEKEIINRGLSK